MAQHPQSTYKPEYDQIIIDMLAEGKSIVEFCAAIRIAKRSVYVWRDMYPDTFGEAYHLAMTLAEAWWVKQGQEQASNPDFNANMWYFNLGSRFGIGGKGRKLLSANVAPKGKKIKNPKTLMEKLNNAIMAFEDGEISLHELDQITQSFTKMADLNERDEITKRVEAIVLQLKTSNDGES